MYCSTCGNQVTGAFCSSCGTRQDAAAPPPPPPPGQYAPATVSNTLSTVGIILGAIAFLLFPILFGPAGLICGAIAKSKGEPRAVVALVVSGCGLVLGMLLGVLVWT